MLAAERLAETERFVDVATLLCHRTREVGVSEVSVMLHRRPGPVALVIDNARDVTDEHRLHAVSQHNWDHNPMFRIMRAQLGPIGAEPIDPPTFIPLAREHGYSGRAVYAFVIPAIGPSGWFGTITGATCE